MKTCFSIMPIRPNFDDVKDVIRAAAKECKLKYVRGDLSTKPGNIMAQVMHEIRHAAVVVADITGNNPNVLYELGIAHEIRGIEPVVIITQKLRDDVPVFDVLHLRQFVYEDNAQGRLQLREELPGLLRSALESSLHHESWDVIRGYLPRTRMLTRDLERFIKTAGPKKQTVIRATAAMSSIAISDNEPADPKLGQEYIDALIAERNALRKALARGAQLKAVLNPPRRFTHAMLPARQRVRFERLIGLLEGHSDSPQKPRAADEDLKAIKNCEFALSPVPMPNTIIIGDQVAYEGLKRGGTGGFEVTHCETSPESLHELIAHFDRFFEDSRQEMIRSHPPDGCLLDQLKALYHEATNAHRMMDP